MLIAPGTVIMWGCGCMAAPSTTFVITPTSDGASIQITIRGVHFYDRSAESNLAMATLTMDHESVHELLALLIQDPAAPSSTAEPTRERLTGGGSIDVTLPLRDTLIRRRVVRGVKDVADRLLELVALAHLPAHDRLRPDPRIDRALSPARTEPAPPEHRVAGERAIKTEPLRAVKLLAQAGAQPLGTQTRRPSIRISRLGGSPIASVRNDWLAPGERLLYSWPGATAETGVLGRLFSRSATLEASDRHRLRLTLQSDENTVIRGVYDSPAAVRFRIVGPGTRRVAMLPTVLVEITPMGVLPFLLLLNETVATYLPRWTTSFDSLTGGGAAAPGSGEAPLDEAQVILPCARCGAPMGSPARRAAIDCPHCGAHTALPGELAERRAFLRGWLHRARRAGDLFSEEQTLRLSQLERNDHARTAALTPLPMIGLVLAFSVIPGLVTQFRSPPGNFQQELQRFGSLVGWLGLALGVVLGLFLAAQRRRRIYRNHLREHLVCLPAVGGVPARCRFCGAPIVVTESVAACSHCGACNFATARVAQSAAAQHARRALILDDRARDARDAERAHLSKLASSIQGGHALGMVVLGPLIVVALAAALAAIHMAL